MSIKIISRGKGKSAVEQGERNRNALLARAVAFVQQHDITSLPGLRNKVVELYGLVGEMSGSLKKIDRRLKTLDEHLKHADNYFRYRDIHRKYRQQKPGRQATFYEVHRAELALYEAAKNYLEGVMNGRTNIPRKEWAAECSRLAANRQGLCAEYAKLKEGVRDAEIIRRCVEAALRDGQQARYERMRETAR